MRDKQALFGLIFAQVFWAAIALNIYGNDADHHANLVFVEAVLLGGPLTTLTHELGHAAVARLTGIEAMAVIVGQGRELFSLRLFGTKIAIRRNIFGGGRTALADPRLRPSRWSAIATVLGGPVANLVVGLGLAILANGITKPDPYEDPNLLTALLGGLALSQWAAALWNLIPLGRGDLENGLMKDGKQLLRLLFRYRPSADAYLYALRQGHEYMRLQRFVEAESALLKALDCKPGEPLALALLIHCTARGRGDPAAVRCFMEHAADYTSAEQRDPSTERDTALFVHANVAWSMLKTEEERLLPLAEEHARIAFEAAPDTLEFAGTLGAWLVATGQAAEGAALLLAAMRASADFLDRSDFSTFLAKASRQLGDEREAQEFTNLSAHFAKMAAR